MNQRLQKFVRIPFQDLYTFSGMFFSKIHQNIGNMILNHRRNDAENQGLGFRLKLFGQILKKLLFLFYDGFGIRDQTLAIGGQGHFAGAAVKQGDGKLLLQLFDMLAEGGLVHEEKLGSLPEIPGFRQC